MIITRQQEFESHLAFRETTHRFGQEEFERCPARCISLESCTVDLKHTGVERAARRFR